MHLLLQRHQQKRTGMPSMHKGSVSTSYLDHANNDDDTIDINKVPDRAKNKYALLNVPETTKSTSLNDVHAAANMASITYEQHSSSGSVTSSDYRRTKPRIQRTQSNFQMFEKKTIPDDRHLKRVLKKAGKQAGVDITTGFTTVVHRAVKHHHAPRKPPQDIQYNPRLTLAPLRRLRSATTGEKVTSNPIDDIAGVVHIGSSHVDSVEESMDHYELVTIVLPLSELDHATKDKKYFPGDFQLHIVLLVDTRLIKDVEYDE